MTMLKSSRPLSGLFISVAVLVACIGVPGTSAAQSAKAPYQLSVFARSQNGYSQPDSIVQWRDSIIVGFQNHVAKDGSDGKSSTLVEYTLDGHVRRTWSVLGHHDGLRVIDGNELWSVQNEDANPNLVIIDLFTGRQTYYGFPSTPHGGGYDDIVQTPQDGKVYLTASNPGADSNGVNVFPALVRIRVNKRHRTLDLQPVVMGNDHSIDLPTGHTVSLNLGDPDSMTLDPRGNIAFTSQADGLLIFVSNPLTQAQQVASINLSSGGSMTTVDDTAFVPSGAEFMLFSDVTADTVYRLDRPLLGFEPGTAYSTSDTTGNLAVLNLDNGELTTIANGFKSTRGIAFITPVD
jgi:hypothetical protein